MNARILIVEDAEGWRRLLAEMLRVRGYTTFEAASVSSARERIRSERPSIMLLDLGLDGEDGYDLLIEAAQTGLTTIVISSRESANERVRCLSLGAADYLIKPVHPDELALRIKRAEMLHTSTLGLAPLAPSGDFLLDLADRRLMNGGKATAPLSPNEFRLIRLLSQKRGDALNRKDIARHVLGREDLIEGRSVDVLVSKLRRKLEAVGGEDLIQSVRGCGYRLRGFATPPEVASASAPIDEG